jgi:lipopolysaccharide export system protein LptA
VRLVLAALAWTALPVALAAGLTGELIFEESGRSELSADGSLRIEDAILSHPDSDTRVTANLALLVETQGSGGVYELELTGAVHIETAGAVLDSTSAVLVFRNQQLVSVQVRGAAATQAQFSHQLEGSTRRINGRADAIDYDATSGKLRFSGDTAYAYADGSASATLDSLTYDINTGVVVGERGSGVFQLNRARDRVPPPRTPDPESAQ